MGFIYIKAGVRFVDFISFFFKYPMKMEIFGLIETKLFHFHRIFKNRGQGGGSSEPHEPPSGSAAEAYSVRLGFIDCYKGHS